MAHRLLRRPDWASAEGWNEKLEGQAVRTGVSLLFNEVDEPGMGPPLHNDLPLAMPKIVSTVPLRGDAVLVV